MCLALWQQQKKLNSTIITISNKWKRAMLRIAKLFYEYYVPPHPEFPSGLRYMLKMCNIPVLDHLINLVHKYPIEAAVKSLYDKNQLTYQSFLTLLRDPEHACEIARCITVLHNNSLLQQNVEECPNIHAVLTSWYKHPEVLEMIDEELTQQRCFLLAQLTASQYEHLCEFLIELRQNKIPLTDEALDFAIDNPDLAEHAIQTICSLHQSGLLNNQSFSFITTQSIFACLNQNPKNIQLAPAIKCLHTANLLTEENYQQLANIPYLSRLITSLFGANLLSHASLKQAIIKADVVRTLSSQPAALFSHPPIDVHIQPQSPACTEDKEKTPVANLIP